MFQCKSRSVRLALTTAMMGGCTAREPDSGFSTEQGLDTDVEVPLEVTDEYAFAYADLGPHADGGEEEVSAEKVAAVRQLITDTNVEPLPEAPYVSQAMYELGQALAFDKILSGDRDVSCMSCHHPGLGTDDDRALPRGAGGVGLGDTREGGPIIPRNAPALFNLHTYDSMFHDQRVSRTEDGGFDTPAGDQLTPEMEATLTYGVVAAQAMFPVMSREEMRGGLNHAEDDGAEDDDCREDRALRRHGRSGGHREAHHGGRRGKARHRHDHHHDHHRHDRRSRGRDRDHRDHRKGRRAHHDYSTDSVNELAQIEDGNFTAVWDALMERLLAVREYRRMFCEAYPDVAMSDLTFAHAANAIAAFEVSAFESTGSPWEQFVRGDDQALTEDELDGALAFAEARCNGCHSGNRFSNFVNFNIGLPQFGPGVGNGPEGNDDFGVENVTGNPADRYKFRTTPLFNVELTAPYGHAGQFRTLEDFIRHYEHPRVSLETYRVEEQVDETALHGTLVDNYDENLGTLFGPFKRRTAPVDIDEEAVATFLRSLTDHEAVRRLPRTVPRRVPSGLPVD